MLKKKRARKGSYSTKLNPGDSVYVWSGDSIVKCVVEGVFVAITRKGYSVEYEFGDGWRREKEEDTYLTYEEAKKAKIKKIESMEEYSEVESITSLIELEKGEYE